MGIEVEGVMSRLNYLPLYKSVCVLSITALLTACNATSPSNSLGHQAPLDNELLLKDELFLEASALDIESQTEIFALSDEMKSLVATEIRPERKPHKKAKKLLTHIFDSNNVGLAYQSHANLTAIETFNSQRANCMSLTIMAFALAEASGLDASFQDVQIPEYWVRNGEYNLLTGHVNLKIHNVKNPSVQTVWGSKNLEIDFDPFIRKKNFPKHKIDKNTVTAMFYNNKGAQSLVAREYSQAYRYFKTAVLVAPKYGASWGNLGILYRFTGHNELAEDAYRQALLVDPRSLNTMNNLALLLERQKRYDESRQIDSAIIKQRIKNPYYHALLADEAFYNGNPESAERHYNRAIKINGKIHELYYGLAKVLNAQGKHKQAKRALKKAININKLPDIERQYIAKLNLMPK